MVELMMPRVAALCTRPEQTNWFSLGDCVHRYSLVLGGFAFALTTTPLSFIEYTFRYNMCWYGNVTGFIMSLAVPVMPAVLCAAQVVKKIKMLFDPSDWQSDGPGRVFFQKPKNPIGSFIWDCYLTQSMYVGQYFLVGCNKQAISHTLVDTLLTKDFWRGRLEHVGGRVPRELARWENSKLMWNYELEDNDVVVKIEDSYLGIGDAFWNHNKDYTDKKSLEAKMIENYTNNEFDGKTALVLELVRPKPELGVHQLDIITMRTPDDDVKVISVLLWADCTTSSSHSTRAGYTIDIETETVAAPAGWYSPFFATMNTPLIGTKFEGVKKACASAIAAHKAVPYKWLTAVGWDCMIMKNDEVVFFEGNFAGARTPRRMFLSAKHFWAFMSVLFWPFKRGGSVLHPFVFTVATEYCFILEVQSKLSVEV
eukprot:m.15425 g.15425  ORF g.15425 m.15425 type:complete len:425 (+) comp10745_c0_seq2:239-1513(+)